MANGASSIEFVFSAPAVSGWASFILLEWLSSCSNTLSKCFDVTFFGVIKCTNIMQFGNNSECKIKFAGKRARAYLKSATFFAYLYD